MTDQFFTGPDTIPGSSTIEPATQLRLSLPPALWLLLGGAATAGWLAVLGWATILLAQYAFS
jgi:hypothetical protein